MGRGKLVLHSIDKESTSLLFLEVVLEPIQHNGHTVDKERTLSLRLPSLRSSCQRESCGRNEDRRFAVEECSTYL